MSLFRIPHRHKFYLTDLHVFQDGEAEGTLRVVGGMCHVCEQVFTADCGLNLPGDLDGYRPKPCEHCNGTGVEK